jgi:hypothetical protein
VWVWDNEGVGEVGWVWVVKKGFRWNVESVGDAGMVLVVQKGYR